MNDMVAGCHVEGPYISHEDGARGAHPREHVRGCDIAEWERWQTAAGGRIRLVTLAPEAHGAVEFVRHVTKRGVTVAIGHTAANSDQIAAVVEAGATLSTHLGNGIAASLPRHPNPIWDQIAEPRLAPSLITDGHHIPANFFRAVLLAKGIENCIITCDASGLAGLHPGEYEYNGGRFEVLSQGPIVIAGQRKLLAGSGQLTDDCVAAAMEMAHLSLADACDLAGKFPSRRLGCETIDLIPGCRADLILFDHHPGKLTILATLLKGELRFGSLSS